MGVFSSLFIIIFFFVTLGQSSLAYALKLISVYYIQSTICVISILPKVSLVALFLQYVWLKCMSDNNEKLFLWHWDITLVLSVFCTWEAGLERDCHFMMISRFIYYESRYILGRGLQKHNFYPHFVDKRGKTSSCKIINLDNCY